MCWLLCYWLRGNCSSSEAPFTVLVPNTKQHRHCHPGSPDTVDRAQPPPGRNLHTQPIEMNEAPALSWRGAPECAKQTGLEFGGHAGAFDRE